MSAQRSRYDRGMRALGVLVAVWSMTACSKGKDRSDLAECFELCTTTKLSLVDYRRKARLADAGTGGPSAAALPPREFDAEGNIVKCGDGRSPRCPGDDHHPPVPDGFVIKSCADGTKPICPSPSPSPPPPLAAPEDVRAECAELCIATRAKAAASQ